MSALLSDVELSVLTVIIARGELLTNRDAQRLRGHIEALGEKYAAAVALAEASVDYEDASWTAGVGELTAAAEKYLMVQDVYRKATGRVLR